MLAVVGNSFSAQPCGQGLKLELSQGGKGNKAATAKTLSKSVWTCLCGGGVRELQGRAGSVSGATPGVRSCSGRVQVPAYQFMER